MHEYLFFYFSAIFIEYCNTTKPSHKLFFLYLFTCA